MKKIIFIILCQFFVINAQAQNQSFKEWSPTPPMGWNSYDCYGSTVLESEVKANADYMARHLKKYGWEYIVIDIRWYVENDKAGGYNEVDPRFAIDQYGRFTPALNRFPSALDGNGFKSLADYIHSKGLKFGIHVMRGLPQIAAEKKMPVLGTDGITCDMICNHDSVCPWLRDTYTVDYTKRGAQEYYNSIFNLYAQWGVDYVKVDDIASPYHKGEVELVRHAIDQCGRPMVLSISPGEAPIRGINHIKAHANLWRTTGDLWDTWPELKGHFSICAKWAPHVEPGNWADADMLPLGLICLRSVHWEPHRCGLSKDEQMTMMNLWYIAKAPLMFGGELTENDKFTNYLLTNKRAIYIHDHSVNNRQVSSHDDQIIWSADDPQSKVKYVAVFNTGDQGSQEIPIDLTAIGFDKNQKCRIENLWSGHKEGTYMGSNFRPSIASHASRLYRITPVK